jgi:fatty-acyl-CoA synthase
MVKSDSWDWSAARPTGNLSVGKIIKNASIACPEKKIIDGTRGIERTYKEINKRVNSIANALLSSGYKYGDRITALTRNGIETIEIYFACAKAGLTLIPVSFRLLPQEIQSIMKYMESDIIIFDEMFTPIVDQISLDIKEYVIGEKAGKYHSYDDLLNNDTKEPGIEISEDTLINFGHTSGTTGSPKFIVRTQYANFCNHASASVSFDITSKDMSLTAIPPLTGVAWTAAFIFSRASAVFMDFDPLKILESIERYKVTIMAGVPAIYQALLAVPDLEKYDLSSLRAVMSVGSYLPISVLEGIWGHITPNVYDEYGLQEAGVVTVINPEMKRIKPESAGTPGPMQEIRIVDNEDNDLPNGEIGEVIIKSAESAGEYLGDDQKTKESFKNGWFYTGDLGRLDEDGYLYIVGRKKDMIVSGGYNVYASDVEEVILGNPKVAECAVMGLPDEKWGERVSAVIKLKEGESLTEIELIEYCREKITNYKAPKSVYFIDEIPKTLSGKVMKFKLVEQFENRQA